MNLMNRLAVSLTQRSKFFRYHVSYDLPIKRGGAFLKVPVVNGMGLEHLSDDEEGVQRIVRYLLSNSPGAFVDVGANIGQTLLKVIASDRNRRYIGFEVQPNCVGYLDRLIRANSLTNTQLFSIGLYSRSMVMELYTDGEADPGASVVDGLRNKSYSISYPVVLETGDCILRQLQFDAIAVIKIDVEGAEADVLLGMSAIIAQHRPALLIEILPTNHLQNDSSVSQTRITEMTVLRNKQTAAIKAFAKEHSYLSFRIMPDGHLQRTEEYEMSSYDHNLVNYLFIGTEAVDLVQEIVK